MSSSFAALGVCAETVELLAARGIAAPFPIQAMAIPPGLSGRDICGKAPTGSGKTIAFGIPVAARVGRGRPHRPQALILAPTRELASQIHAEMRNLMGRRGRYVAAFYGGVGFGAQLYALEHGVDVAVACPGRLKDLIGRRAISLADVSIVVVDEADRMADMGFLPDVTAILEQVRADRQTMLFSATLDGDVDELVRRFQRDPVYVSVDAEDDRSPVDHQWVDTKREDRISLTARIVGTRGPTIVFCRTQRGTDRVATQLVKVGVDAVPIHGGLSQSQRERALAAFATGRAQALVATDVAARGIHVDGVGCVVHFDLPETGKDYLHRSGRTGRAGEGGVVISFVGEADGHRARSLRREIGDPVAAESRPAPARPDHAAGRPRRPVRGPSSVGRDRNGVRERSTARSTTGGRKRRVAAPGRKGLG